MNALSPNLGSPPVNVARAASLDSSWLRETYSGRLRRNVALAARTSWRVGGVADWWFEPIDTEDLAGFFEKLSPRVPVTVLGLGSNVLVRDGGIRGLVVSLRNLRARSRSGDDRMHFGAGMSCAQAARMAAREGLGGIEFLAGIPGTVGGALAMNAGAWGGEIWPRVHSVTLVERGGIVRTLPFDAFEWGYRWVRPQADATEGQALEGCVFVAVELQLEALDDPAARKQVEQRIRALLRDRAERQPQGVPSCGSVFRNPPGDSAGRLIDAAGFKGLRQGGAEVSTKHANFIIHDGTASAADIEALIEAVRAGVLAHSGVELETEVRILGTPTTLTTEDAT